MEDNNEELTEEQKKLAEEQHGFDEVLIGFDVAKLAAEKGFNHPRVLMAYKVNKEHPEGYYECMLTWELKYGSTRDTVKKGIYLRPTQSQLQRWLRTKGVHIEVKVQDYVETHEFYWGIFGNHSVNNIIRCLISSDREDYESYEEALEDALYHGLNKI